MCENIDHNQQSFSVNRTALVWFDHRYWLADHMPRRCFPGGTQHVTHQRLLVQTWVCCKFQNIKQVPTAAVLQKHLIRKLHKGRVLMSPGFKRDTCKNSNYLCFLLSSTAVPGHYYLLPHLLCLSNKHCPCCLTPSISRSAESCFLNKQKPSPKYAQKHKIFQLARNQ